MSAPEAQHTRGPTEGDRQCLSMVISRGSQVRGKEQLMGNQQELATGMGTSHIKGVQARTWGVYWKRSGTRPGMGTAPSLLLVSELPDGPF